MNKINLSLLFLILIHLSCVQEMEESVVEVGEVSVVFELGANMTLKDGTNDPVYYLEDCSVEEFDYIRLSISQVDDFGEIIPLPDYENIILATIPVGDGVATELIKLREGNYAITRFEVLRMPSGGLTEEDMEIVMATPLSTSAFSAYVSTPLNYQFSATLYQKNRITMEVLCFEPADIAKFGFEWSDVEVITGDGLCMHVLQCQTVSDTESHWSPANYLVTMHSVTETGEAGTVYYEDSSTSGWICFPLWGDALAKGLFAKIHHLDWNGELIIREHFFSAEEIERMKTEAEKDPLPEGEGFLQVTIPCE